MSKAVKGWKGLRLAPLRRTAAFTNPRSKEGLCPTSTARLHPFLLSARRTGLKTCSSASFSGRAKRKGW